MRLSAAVLAILVLAPHSSAPLGALTAPRSDDRTPSTTDADRAREEPAPRGEAEKALCPRFDVREIHEVAVLEQQVRGWIAGEAASK